MKNNELAKQNNTLYNYGTNIDKVENVYVSTNGVISAILPPLSALDNSYYHLIVSNELAFNGSQEPILISYDQYLTRFTVKEIKNTFTVMTSELQEKIKSIPCIFTKLYDFNNPEAGHFACIGCITNLSFKTNAISLDYKLYENTSIDMKTIEALTDKLLIAKKEFNSELEYTHWAIKKCNALEILGRI